MNQPLNFRRSLMSAALAASLIAGFAGAAAAHSVGACTDAVVVACNAAHPNNYNARIACVNNGITQCTGHSHGGGGGGVKPGASDFTSGSQPEQSTIRRSLKIR